MSLDFSCKYIILPFIYYMLTLLSYNIIKNSSFFMKGLSLSMTIDQAQWRSVIHVADSTKWDMATLLLFHKITLK